MRISSPGWGIVAGALILVGAAGLALSQSTLPPPRPVKDATAFEYLGPAACAYCHGRTQTLGALSGEHTTWIKTDPHARAFTVLLEPRSQRIVELLGGDEPAHKDPRCLNCHVQPNLDQSRFRDKGLFLREGVSCESCHGPAERYISEHYKSGWKRMSFQDKTALGFRDTRSLAGRTKLCVDCHVGAPGGDVNHDLLAAGHPPLKFEFTAFHEAYPKHWDDAKDRDPAKDPRGRQDFEVQAWLEGQLASAEATLKLLAERAGNEKLAWPEFAEYDCVACHHNLKVKSWRQQRYLDQAGKRKIDPGALAWGEWYFSIPKALAQRDEKGQRFREGLGNLAKEMAKGQPRRERARNQARALTKDLAAICDTLPRQFTPVELNGTLPWLGKHERWASSEWSDGAGQYALALAAMDRTGRDAGLPESFSHLLRTARQELRFPAIIPFLDSFPDAIKRRFVDLGLRRSSKE